MTMHCCPLGDSIGADTVVYEPVEKYGRNDRAQRSESEAERIGTGK
jgi:hypothetical protein